MQRKVLFIDTVHPALPEALCRAGYACDYFTGLHREDYLRIIGEYAGVIIRGKIRLDREMLAAAVKLKFIARAGAGMENIDAGFAAEHGILCLNAPEGNRDAVAEHALGMLLSLLNHLRRADAEVRQGRWQRETNRGSEIMGKTVGIVGFGNTGSAFAERLRGFGARVIAYDKYKEGFGNEWVEEVPETSLFAGCDILSLHVPLTPETQGLVSSEYLARFHKSLFLINTSRGKVVKTTDLVKAIEAGKVRGAALDVLEYEGLSFESLENDSLPEDFRYLAQCDRVLLSPHIAGWTLESHRRLSEVLAEKIISSVGPCQGA